MPARTGPFGRSLRLLHSREFQHVARRGRRAVVGGFVVLAAPRVGSPGGGSRLGITVSRKVGNAVQRNHVKRRIREWFRRDRRFLEGDLDLVVIGRRAAVALSGSKAAGQLREASERLGLRRS